MFFEYAVDPCVLSSWDRARFFLDSFGPWKGRFLAEFPRKWKRMVFENLMCPDVEKKRIVERLTQLDRRVFSPRTNADYDGARSWFDNAIGEHARKPFRAIVTGTAAGSGEPFVLDGAVVDDTNEHWHVETGRLVARDAAVLLRVLELLLDASRNVLLIDPYFRPDQVDKTRPLSAISSRVLGRATVEVHFSDEPRGYLPCMQDASRALPALLPTGAKVNLHCWRERSGGPRLHNRYLLTEVGGVKFGDGIETGCSGQEDHVSILDEPSRFKLWEQFKGAPPAFDLVGEPREFVGDTRP